MSVSLYYEGVKSGLVNKKTIDQWIEKSILNEEKNPGEISVIFCDDEYLYKMNVEKLKHDFYTDIITFNYVVGDVINGDLFISVDRVKENAEGLNQTFKNELLRVIIHGILHLCGYNDKTKTEENLMRKLEDHYIEEYKKNHQPVR